MQGVRVSCSEGVANHTGPESWLGRRETAGQALTGEHVGWVLSREMVQVRGADGFPLYGRQHRGGRQREPTTDPARSETPCMRGSIVRGTREVPSLAAPSRRGPRGESTKEYGRDER